MVAGKAVILLIIKKMINISQYCWYISESELAIKLGTQKASVRILPPEQKRIHHISHFSFSQSQIPRFSKDL